MLDSLKQLLGLGPAIDYSDLIKQGALIVDVRSQGEYASGHIKGSINIPVDTLHQHAAQLKDKHQPIITCCASGIRSASAKQILSAKGYTKVYNGGGWSSLQQKIK